MFNEKKLNFPNAWKIVEQEEKIVVEQEIVDLDVQVDHPVVDHLVVEIQEELKQQRQNWRASLDLEALGL